MPILISGCYGEATAAGFNVAQILEVERYRLPSDGLHVL
jgi:hypothetical protein